MNERLVCQDWLEAALGAGRSPGGSGHKDRFKSPEEILHESDDTYERVLGELEE